jgi:hypothetical protein
MAIRALSIDIVLTHQTGDQMNTYLIIVVPEDYAHLFNDLETYFIKSKKEPSKKKILKVSGYNSFSQFDYKVVKVPS